jgi:hypothetical protein
MQQSKCLFQLYGPYRIERIGIPLFRFDEVGLAEDEQVIGECFFGDGVVAVEFPDSEFAALMKGAEDINASWIGNGLAEIAELLVIGWVEVFFREGHGEVMVWLGISCRVGIPRQPHFIKVDFDEIPPAIL